MGEQLTQRQPKPRRYRLLARTQLDGEVRQPGYVFTLGEGERGPHKTVVASNADGMAWRRQHSAQEIERIPPGHGWTMPEEYLPTMRDEPLFEEIKED
jgi:hypothetical protein